LSGIEETRRQVKRGEKAQRWLAVLAAVLLAASLLAGFNHSPFFFLGTLAALPAAAAAAWVYYRLKGLKALLMLRERWGGRVKKERDFAIIASLFDHLQTSAEDTAVVDEQTWRDLNLDQVYALMDRTFTAEGQAVLYRILRSPCLTLAPLQDRAAVIKLFQEDTPFREKIQLALLHLEGRSEKDSTGLLWGDLPQPSPAAPLYHLLALAALLSLLSPLFLGPQGLALIMGMFGLNIYVHHRVSKTIAHRLPAVSSLAALLRTALKLSRLERRPELRERQDQLQQAASACRPILKKIRFLHPRLFVSDLDLIYDYFKYFFLLEVRGF